MTIGTLHPDLPTNQSAVPRFDHAIGPWLLVGVSALLTVLLIAFFIYGQLAPGA